jgi:hypothetical protein
VGERTALPTSPADPAASTDAFHLRLFAVAWALAALFHTEYHALVWRQHLLAPRLSAALLTAAAVATCWRPGPRTLVALAVAQLVDVAVLLPEVPNHWQIAALANVGWLVAAAGTRQPAALLRRAQAPLMVAVALFYLWTGLWKLNADFFRPEVSCAVVSWDRVLGFFRWLPDADALRRGVIAGTLAMELIGPLLLLWPVTRGAAVVAFIGFHLCLGLDAVKIYLNFSSVMFALLLLFLSGAAVERLRALLPTGGVRLPRVAAAACLVLAAAGIAAGRGSPLYLVGRWFLWLGYGTALLVLVTLAVVGAPRPRRVLPAGARRLAWVVPLLVALNGTAPLLGLKTRTSWQMYSNIRLEPAVSNHFFFPRNLDLLGAQADLVTVDRGGDHVRDVAGTGLALPWIEFQRRAAADPDAAVVWRHDGERHEAARPADDPLLSRRPPLLVRKLAIFRPLGPAVVRRCDW